jgi:hypothetical protein
MDLDAMIQDFETKIAAMQEAVASLKKARDAISGLTTGGPGRNAEIGPDTFTGMSIEKAGEKFLRLVGRPARTTQEIVDGLLRGGLPRVSPESVATIFIRSHNSDGAVVRVQKGLWGLADWYPKRPPKLKRTKGGEEEEAEELSKSEEPGEK